MNGNRKKIKVSDIENYINPNTESDLKSTLFYINKLELENYETKNICDDLKKKHAHLKNLEFINDRHRIADDQLTESTMNKADDQLTEFIMNKITNTIKNSKSNSINQTMFTYRYRTNHIFGFIFGRNKDNKPYILHYDYNTFKDQDTDICNAIAKQYKEKYKKDLYILRIPKLQHESKNCALFQLVLMRYMKPEYIEKYMEKAKPGVNPIELKDLPKKLLSFYQSRDLNKIAPELWEQNRKDRHIVKEKVYDKEAGGEVLKDQNHKSEHKKQMLHLKYNFQRNLFQNINEKNVDDIISETESEIAGQQIAEQQDAQTNECCVKRFFKNLWKKLKGFFCGTRCADNSQAANNLNNRSSCELKK